MSQDVSDISSAEHYTWGGVCDGWHLLKHPALSVIQERVPASAGEALHFHVNARQFFYVLSGVATMEFEGRSVTFGPNQGLHVPPDTPHRFANHSDADVVFLVISSPTTAGDRINVSPPG
jgi:mannose-6-phosphate isomerase-like protein (cupin superfamily)